MTPSRGVGDTRPKINFLWLNLERTLDKRRAWEDVSGEETTAKRSSLLEAMTKKGRQIFLPPRVTPTLVTPLFIISFQSGNKDHKHTTRDIPVHIVYVKERKMQYMMYNITQKNS